MHSACSECELQSCESASEQQGYDGQQRSPRLASNRAKLSSLISRRSNLSLFPFPLKRIYGAKVRLQSFAGGILFFPRKRAPMQFSRSEA